MKNYARYLTIPIVLGFGEMFGYTLHAENGIYSSEALMLLAFSSADDTIVKFPEILFAFVPLLLFQIIYGTYIYRFFCTASVYFFSRNNNRGRWFLKEAGALLGFAFLYISIYSVSSLSLPLLFGRLNWDRGIIASYVYFALIYTLFLFSTTLLINVLSILISGMAGLIIVEAGCILSIAFFTMTEMLSHGDALLEERLLKINPFTHLVLSFHSSELNSLLPWVNAKGIEMRLDCSVILFLCMAVFAAIVGAVTVCNHSFVSNDKESGEF